MLACIVHVDKYPVHGITITYMYFWHTITTTCVSKYIIYNLFAGVDLVKPSTIYYNTNELLKGLPGAGKDETSLRQKGLSKRDSSGSEERYTPATPSAPAPTVRPKPPQRSFSVVSPPPDSASLDLIESARVAVLEDRIKVRLLTMCAPGGCYCCFNYGIF